jgi:hypothetical protein
MQCEGVLEYWSTGVLDVIEPEVDKPRFRQSISVIIGSVNAFEQNKLS